MKAMTESYAPKYLVCVTTSNNNKFYRMLPDASQNGFTVEYGRIGAPSFRTEYYPISMFDKKYHEKLKKGYVDQTSIVKAAIVQTNGEDGLKAIADPDVNRLITALRKYANETIKQNYTISQNAITKAMLDKAQTLIDELNHIVDSMNSGSSGKTMFNSILVDIFKTIPRKMNKVSGYLLQAEDTHEAVRIIDREQKLHDVLLASFQTQQAETMSNDAPQSVDDGPTQTILERLGLEFELVVDKSKIEQIKSHLGQVAPKFKRAFVVVNKQTQSNYAAFMSANPNCKTKLVFHGSKNENFWSILKSGLKLNPKASVTGKMLGLGIYGADKAIKSLNYTSIKGSSWARGTSSVGYLAVFAFAIDPKNCYNVTTVSEIDTCHGMTWDKLQKTKPGATYVFAHKGAYLRENEICVYREDQCTIRYLIELQA